MSQLENFFAIEKVHISEEDEDCDKKEEKLTLIFPANGYVLNKTEYYRLLPAQCSNKKRSSNEFAQEHTLFQADNADLDYNKKKIAKKCNLKNFNTNINVSSANCSISNVKDPERKIYLSWSLIKLENEISKLKQQIEKQVDLEKEEDQKGKEIEKFEDLSEKWLKIAQGAIYQLIDLFPQNANYEKNTIKSVLEHFKIDRDIINYDSENECFKD